MIIRFLNNFIIFSCIHLPKAFSQIVVSLLLYTDSNRNNFQLNKAGIKCQQWFQKVVTDTEMLVSDSWPLLNKCYLIWDITHVVHCPLKPSWTYLPPSSYWESHETKLVVVSSKSYTELHYLQNYYWNLSALYTLYLFSEFLFWVS